MPRSTRSQTAAGEAAPAAASNRAPPPAVPANDTAQPLSGQRSAGEPQGPKETEPTDPLVERVVPGVEPGTAGGAEHADLREQIAAMAQLLQQQSHALHLLRTSPQGSPNASPQASPQASPVRLVTPPAQAERAEGSPSAAAALTSRFARKEPRAQDLREYDGASGAKLDDWLDELGAAVDLYQLNPREAVDFAVSRLRGAARQWWNALGTDGRAAATGPSQLGQALRARFQPVTSERLAREQLRALRQGSRHVNEYIAEFQRLRALLPDMSEPDALFAFESGLQPALALELRKQGSSTLADALALAARIGSLTSALAASGSQPHRAAAAAANQMDIDDGDGASLDERISRAVVNAMQSQQAQPGAGSSGFGAKTQTQRGYQAERSARNGARAGQRGGRGGGSRPNSRPLPVVPGVPPELVQQRWDAKQCLRCGTDGHTSHACTNAISARPSN